MKISENFKAELFQLLNKYKANIEIENGDYGLEYLTITLQGESKPDVEWIDDTVEFDYICLSYNDLISQDWLNK